MSVFLLEREFWRKSSNGTRRSPTAEEQCEAHRGQAELDQQGVQTRRGREREAGGDAGEYQSSERTLRAAHEEIKVLREDLPREGESMDKHRSHIMSLESTEEIRNLEQQELNLCRGAAAKRPAGWTRDGSTEETASWSVEAERISRQAEGKKRKIQEAVGKESTMRDVRMSDERMDGLDGSLSS